MKSILKYLAARLRERSTMIAVGGSLAAALDAFASGGAVSAAIAGATAALIALTPDAKEAE